MYLLLIHLILCLLVFLGIQFKILKVHKYIFFVALLLPFWGLLVVLILHFQIFFDADDSIDIDVEKMRLDSELYKGVTVDEKKVAASTVPIEEALLINSPKERRSIIMDVLNDNPKEYIEFLQKAGNNEDTEVVHYAVTAMVEISKENDFHMQKLEREYSKNPDDPEILTRYIDFLWDCLSKNLLEGQVEIMNRRLFSTLILKRIELFGKLYDYTRAVENQLKLKNYTEAGELLGKMDSLFPENEEYYLLKIQYFASLNRGKDIKKVLGEIEERHVFLSSKTKEVLAFWQN